MGKAPELVLRCTAEEIGDAIAAGTPWAELARNHGLRAPTEAERATNAAINVHATDRPVLLMLPRDAVALLRRMGERADVSAADVASILLRRALVLHHGGNPEAVAPEVVL